jgi:hypothetical protein
MGPFRWRMLMAIALPVALIAGVVAVKLHSGSFSAPLVSAPSVDPPSHSGNSSAPPHSAPSGHRSRHSRSSRARRHSALSVDLSSFTSAAFSYGFDYDQGATEFSPLKGENRGSRLAAASAAQVLTSMPGVVQDTPIIFWGMPDPEPTPGHFDLSGLASRINFITATDGIPVITLCGAPPWMTGGSGPTVAPTPGHYQAFATLAAKIAASFPQVKYFVVWNELKGFSDDGGHNWNIRSYTLMYNDVYRAIKSVRPDALIGGPYAPTDPLPRPGPDNLPSTPHGPWGYLVQPTLNAISYWLANKAGAQFIAVDGRDFPTTGIITDPLTATEKYAAMDTWLREQTSLPIWWTESFIQPESFWPAGQAAAVRVATLVQMASSGARVGMQWQPQQQAGDLPNEGLWLSGRSLSFPPTTLAQILPPVLAVLGHQVSIVPGQPFGVLVASGPGGTIAVNTTNSATTALVGGSRISLGPGQVRTSISHA